MVHGCLRTSDAQSLAFARLAGKALLLRGDIGKTFVALWNYVANITFRSPEEFAAHCHTPDAMAALATEPLIPLTEQQRESVSADYARTCITAQLAARGLPLDSKPVSTRGNRPYDALAPLWLQDESLSPGDWSSKAAVHFNTAFRSCGNHTCMKRVCYKGKHGRKGLYRMLYWHWRLCPSKKKPIKRFGNA